MRHKIIFHMDMDQFFAAVEMLHNPALRGLPIVVGGNALGQGIVTTASYEARRYGIKSGMTAADAARLCPHAVFVKPDSTKYLDLSRRILKCLLEFTDRVEPTSVDEAYLDVTDLVWHEQSVEQLGWKIKQAVRECTEGLTASIGGGANRVVAKVASGLKKPDGFTYLPPDRVMEVYRNLDVGELCGVGRATESVLRSFGVHTVGQLAEFPLDILKRRFGKYGEDLKRMANGEGDDLVRTPAERPAEKSMGHEHTFSRNLTDPELMKGRLHLLCERVARRLRAARMAGSTVTVKVRYDGFETILHGHKLKRFIQHELDIYPVAEFLFHQVYEAPRSVRLIGVHVSELIETSALRQQELFVAPVQPDRLNEACDAIKDRFGENAIGFMSGTFQNGEKPRTRRGPIPFTSFSTYLIRPPRS